MDYNKNQDELQEKFKPKKVKTIKVTESMVRLRMFGRAERMSNCGDWLKFMECTFDGYKKLVGASFCRDRLCPMCNWRRSRLLFGQIMEMLHVASTRRKMRFMFLKLDVVNCTGDKLSETIDMMFQGFNELFKYKDVDKNIIGWVRNLEVTYNAKENTYHPHFHILIAVAPNYFNTDEYIRQSKWTALWQRACRLDYKPVVDIRIVRPKKEGQTIEGAVAETAKYSVKDADYIRDTDSETDKIIEVLANALRCRRLIGFGKLFRAIRKELNQKDVESATADLVAADGEGCLCPLCQSNLQEQLYKWDFYSAKYIRSGQA